MRHIILYILPLFFIFPSCSKKQEEKPWIKLFNEKDLNDWIIKIHHYDVGDNFDSTFSVKDSIIQIRYNHYGEFNDRFGHLFYKTPFSNYHLKFEYRFKDARTGKESEMVTHGGNFKDFSGLKFPTKIDMKRDDKKFLEAEILEVKPVEKLDPSLFTKP